MSNRPPFVERRLTGEQMDALAGDPRVRHLPVQGAPGAAFLAVGLLTGIAPAKLGGPATPWLTTWSVVLQAAEEFGFWPTACATTLPGRVRVLFDGAFLRLALADERYAGAVRRALAIPTQFVDWFVLTTEA